MTPTSECEDLETTGPSSALEVALGLVLAGAVCGLVALSQSASASASPEVPPLAAASAQQKSGKTGAVASQAGTTQKQSDSMDLALLLRQRSSANLLIEGGR